MSIRIDKTTTVLSLGFAAVLGLTVLLSIVSLSVLHTGITRLESIVHNHNLKSSLIVRMRTAARERTVCLQKMLLMRDIFDRDHEWMRFNRLASDFATARAAILQLDVNASERALLNRQDAIIRRVSPIQSEIAELILNGSDDKAHELILTQAIPLQDQAFKIMSQLLKLQQDAANQAAARTQTDYDHALTMILALAGAVGLLSLLISGFVVRRTSEAEQRLHEEKERALVTLYSIGDGVITTNSEGQVEHMNAVAESLTGWTTDQARHRPLSDVCPMVTDPEREPTPDPVEQALIKGGPVGSLRNTLLLRPDGQDAAIEYSVAPIHDRWHNHVTGAILVFRDVTEMRNLSHQLAYQATHDPLTGLLNRRELEARLQETLAEARRYPDQQHWLCYIDMDQFKVINDTCGHLAGDELLKQVAADLRRHVRRSDLVARTGGDEFAILLKHCDEAEARDSIERMRKSLHELRFAWDDKSFSVSASFGLVQISDSSGSLYDLLSAADTACYVSKDEGRNRVHVYMADDDATSRRQGEMQWVHRIHEALSEDRFVLYYQTIAPLQQRREKRHCEILVRMLNPDGSLVPPMAFIPGAERYNLMADIDRWVIRNTLTALAGLRVSEPHIPEMVSINLSTQSLCDDDLLPFVLNQLERTGVEPRRICFEITETAAIANLSRARQFITALQARGCRFSLDDFGSGLSSFGYLKSLPVDFLKIDGGFVRDILDDPIDLALVESINQIGHILDIRTIAEYVENDRIAAVLRRLGVDYAQGYAIDRPAPLAELAETRPAIEQALLN